MYNIAIDGPAGAVKSTIATTVAAAHGLVYVDTGAMYRAMAYYFLQHDISSEDQQAVEAACPDIRVTIEYQDGEQQVLLNGENVNAYIRTEQVSLMTSKVSQYPKVREKLVSLQKQLAAEQNVIMDGRDIGTCVLPDADAKIYLTASVKERATRRYKEQIEKGMQADLSEIEADIEKRDYQDMHREVSPLCQAEDAVLVDSSDMTIKEVVEEIIRIFEEKKA
mgnify:CR=1 FL=1